jgi:dTMP kinase
VLLDLAPEAARVRLDSADKPFDRLEAEKTEFHARVRDACLALAAAEPERFLVLDADASPEAIAAQIRERVQSLLG